MPVVDLCPCWVLVIYHRFTDGRFLDLLMFVRPSVSTVFTQMPWMDFFDITHVFEVPVGVDARHFRIFKIFKMAAWRAFFIFGDHVLCSNSKTMDVGLFVKNTLLGHFLARFYLASSIL